MFDLNQAIREWTARLRRNEAMEEADLAEMESHLRDEIDRQMAAGLGAEAAFRAAASLSAPAEDLGREYGKFRFHQKHYPFWHPARFMPALAWNCVKVAARNFKRQKGYSLINVAGLAAGMAACILIFLWVHNDLSYDRFHAKADRIYRLIIEDLSGAKVQRMAGIPAPLGPAVKAEIPEIEAFARVQSGFPWSLHKGDGKSFNPTERLAGVDASFFEIFDFPSVSGDPAAALSDPSGILITTDLARKFFGDEDPLGKTLKLNDEDVLVRGILKRIPRNTHFDFAFVLPLAKVAAGRHGRLDDWNWNQVATYLLLRPGALAKDVEAKAAAMVKALRPDAKVRLSLQPLKDVHLRSTDIDAWMTRYPNPGRLTYVTILSLTALCILFLACLNFLSLSTARYQTRVREAGMRRIFGARRADLLRQFLGESFLLTLLSFAIAVTAVEAVLPAFGALVQKDLALLGSGDRSVYASLLALLLITSFLAGIGPAVFLSSFRPGQLVKSVGRIDPPGKARWRQALVVAQFAATIVLVVFSLTISGQLHFIRTKDMGIDLNNLIFLSTRIPPDSREAWKAEILRNPDVLSLSAVWAPQETEMVRRAAVDWEGKDPAAKVGFAHLGGDEDALALYRLTMVEGRYFSRDLAGDKTNWVLNETAVAAMGLENPVGKWFSFAGRKGTIIGIVKDFHFGSLHSPIPPRVIAAGGGGYLGLRYRPGKTSAVIAFLKDLCARFAPSEPFRYDLIEDIVDGWYAAERRAGVVLGYFTGLAVLIAALGLLGLASFVAERRTKEIGVRKVLGASVPGILSLISRQFVSWVLLASVIAWPIGYFIVHNWLEGFAYRFDPGLGLFLLSTGLALALTLATVGTQAFRAAKSNPADCLRYE